MRDKIEALKRRGKIDESDINKYKDLRMIIYSI